MAEITVYPTKKNALNLKHPSVLHKLQVGGSIWPRDSFTGRLLTEGSVTDDPHQAWHPSPPLQPEADETVAASGTAPNA